MSKNDEGRGSANQRATCQIPCFDFAVVRRLRTALPAEEAVEESRVLFAALADRTRLKILYALRGGEELCVCDVAHVLGVSMSTASHHLRKLRDLGLLQYRNDGKMAYYSITSPFAAALVAQTLETASREGGALGRSHRARAAGARRSTL